MYWEYGGARDTAYRNEPPMTSPAVRPGVQLPLSGGDSGHAMYWEYGGANDSAFKTDQPPFPHTPGGPPWNENDGIVTKVTSGGNAIEDWGQNIRARIA